MSRAGRIALALAIAAPAAATAAWAQFVPYHGKNLVRWDRFEWKLYRSPHFDVHYYVGEHRGLERLVALAETSYRDLAARLGHEVSFRIPLIAYRSHAEFEETNILGLPVDESIGAFAEPGLNRMVLPLDGPDEDLRRLVAHELTHIFEFSMIYQGLTPQLLVRRPPEWAFEGFADYMSEESSSLKRMLLRDLVLHDRIPRMSQLDFSELPNPVLGYSLGHAAFEAVAERWGEDGIRRLWWGFRKHTLLKDNPAWKSAFGIDDREFDRTVELYLRRRYPLEETRERPWVYARQLELEGGLTQALALAASPSGEALALLAANRSTSELDLVVVSARDGKLLRNLTAGTTDRWEYLATDGRLAEGRAIAWDAEGRQLAVFARHGKGHRLLVFDAASGERLRSWRVDADHPSGASFSPDGQRIAFAARGGERSGLYTLDLASGRARWLGRSTASDLTPCFTPDGEALVAARRKGRWAGLVAVPLQDPEDARALTAGEWNDSAPAFDPAGNLWYVSDRGGAFNVWRLPPSGERAERLTDAVGGNFSPMALQASAPELAFLCYHDGRFQVCVSELPAPRETLALPAAGARVHLAESAWPALDPASVGRAKRGLKLTGVAEVTAGISSDGTFLGQSAAVFEDLLGDRELVIAARSIRDFRSIYLGYTSRERRLAWRAELYDLRSYFLADPTLEDSLGRIGSEVVQVRALGGGVALRYPFSRLRRLEAGLGYEHLDRGFRVADVEDRALSDGGAVRVSAAFVEETTRFRWFGPLSGRTLRLDLRAAPGFGSLLGYWSVQGDGRAYLRLSRDTLFAFRAHGFWSGGKDPEIFAFGGASEFRGAEYYALAGTRGFFGGVELRFPLIHELRTPLLSIGGVRGTLFFDLAGVGRKGRDFTFSRQRGGFRLVDARAVFGAGISVGMLGLPLHFDWSWPTDLRDVESSRFSVWLGYEH